jgi:fructose-bisphosphate aldolase, class II
MFDGSRLPFDDNVTATARLVGIARDRDPAIAVEGEIGVIGGREDTDPDVALATRTTPEEAARFVAGTGVDVVAPALGNLHRMPDESTRLDLAHVRAVADATDRPIALHGGSGIERSQLCDAVAAGIGKVNISSRVTRALASGIRTTWAERPDELDLRRFLGAGREAVRAMASAYFELTGIAGRAPAAAGSAAWTAHDVEPE